MDFILHNLRLAELVAIVQENKAFYEDFVHFLQTEGYNSILDFIQEPVDEKAAATLQRYLERKSEVKLYDGVLRPYANGKAKWFFLAWLLRDAATQRLQPLLKGISGKNDKNEKLSCSMKFENLLPHYFQHRKVGSGLQFPKLCYQGLKVVEGR